MPRIATRARALSPCRQLPRRFVRRGGGCEGCAFCENHGDVAQLVPRWQNRDYDFFAGFYVGMASIRHSMEQLLFEDLPDNPGLASLLTEENILDYRREIIKYTDEHFF